MRDRTLQAMYNTWASMIGRCENKNSKDYPNWGGRGITVCERWRCVSPKGTGFKNFVADMGMRPPQMTLDRKDNDGNYEPSNCRWATRKEQFDNSRQHGLALGVPAHAAKQRAKTHCKYGHEFNEQNIYPYKGMRLCRACRLAHDRWTYHGRTRPFEEYLYPKGKPGRRPKIKHDDNP